MRDALLSSLINKDVVKAGTEITILRPGSDLSGQKSVFVPHDIEVESCEIAESAIVHGSNIIDGRTFRIYARHILRIDGMDPVRLARVYGLKEDGTALPRGKKRGRRPNKKA